MSMGSGPNWGGVTFRVFSSSRNGRTKDPIFLIEGSAGEIIEPRVLTPSLGTNHHWNMCKMYVAGASRVPAMPKTHERYPTWVRNKPPKKL